MGFLSSLGKFGGSVGSAFNSAVGSAYNTITSPLRGVSTSGLTAEQDEIRRQRAQFLNEYNGGRGVQDVSATTTQAANAGPIERATAAGVQPVDMANAGQIERTNGATAGVVAEGSQVDAARVGPMAQGTAQQGSAATAARSTVDVQGQGTGLQNQAASLLQEQATGKGPSVAELQLKSSLNDIGNRQLSAAAGARGSAIGSARRRAAREMSLQQGNAAAQGAQMRAGETMAARQALAGVASDARSQDISVAATQAGLDSQRNLTNASLETTTSNNNAGLGTQVSLGNTAATNQGRLTQAQLEQEARQGQAARIAARAAQQAGLDTQVSINNSGIDASRATNQAGLTTNVNLANSGAVNTGREAAAGRSTTVNLANAGAANTRQEADTERVQRTGEFNAGNQTAVAQNNEDRRATERTNLRNSVTGQSDSIINAETAKADIQAKNKARTGNFLKGAADTVFAAKKLSDKRAKTDIAPARNEAVEAFLDSFDGKTWNYKNPDAPGADPGRQSGAMAQDLDNTPMGQQFVKSTPNGKMLDPSDALGPVLASLSYLNKKIDAVTKTRRAAAREMA